MADYIGIKGISIPTVSSDPSNPVAGQIWYNTTSATLKGYGKLGAGAWAAGGALNAGRYNNAGAGTGTAGLTFGGVPPAAAVALTESYDGSTWTEVGDLNQARDFMAGTGSQTAALCITGQIPPSPPPHTTDLVEDFNGTAWTEVGDVNDGRRNSVGCGITTAALCIGGGPPAPVYAFTEEFNGTAWTEIADTNTDRMSAAGSTNGTTTATLYFGGTEPPGPPNPADSTKTESWNGTSWTEENQLGTGRYKLGGAGIQTDALAYGGGWPLTVNTESFNGTSWTEVANLAVAAATFGHCGSSTNAFGAGGDFPPSYRGCEEWLFADETKTFTAS